MPIVASMGGVAGSQTLTVVIRGMALGRVERSNLNWLLSKEFAVGAINGLLYALIVGCVVSIWFQNWLMAVIIGLAMAINLMAAALAGTILPVLLRSLKVDPALAGPVILTTITDIVGFVSFLGFSRNVPYLMEDSVDDNGYDGPSKSQLKRDSHALQEMGKKLVEIARMVNYKNLRFLSLLKKRFMKLVD